MLNVPSTDAVAYDSVDDQQSGRGMGMALRDFVQVLKIRRRLIFGTAGAVIVITVLVLTQLTRLYTATAVVMLDQRKNNLEDVNSVVSDLPTDQVSMQNQVAILTSRKLADRVIKSLNLNEDPEFNLTILPEWRTFVNSLWPAWLSSSVQMTEAERKEAEHAGVVDEFLKHIDIEAVGLSTAMAAEFYSESPAKSARIANALADAYVEDQLDAKFEATQKATKWLSDRIQELSQQVEQADSAVQQYKAANNLTETAQGVSLVDEQMGTISTQLVTAKADLAQKQAMYGRVSSLERSGHSADVSQVVDSPLIAQLRGQETDLIRQQADLSSKYGPNHPKMLQLASQRANLDLKIREEVGHVVQTVANDAAVASAQVRSLQDSLARYTSLSAGQNQARVRLMALESKATSAKSMYEAFLSRLKETQGQEGITTPDARVISLASEPTKPSFPKALLFMGAALPGGLFLGLMLAFLAERLDSGFRTTNQVEGILKLPVLATIPELPLSKNARLAAADRVVDKPLSAFAEAIRGLQMGLTLSGAEGGPRVVVVTSSVPGEGKTTIALSLARQAARSGRRIVVVDCDLRHPMIGKTLGNQEDAPNGILEALDGSAPFDACLQVDPRGNVCVLSCSAKPANPTEILSSVSLQNLVAKLRVAFDMVIIDSAPMLPVNDTKMLVPLADAFLFVVRWETTPRDAALNALKTLKDTGATIAGAVMTRADPSRFHYYNHGYSNSDYDKYYRE